MDIIQFKKYHGLGNDFIIVDYRFIELHEHLLDPDPNLVKRLCKRNFGIGSDGLILILPPKEKGDFKMKILNSDGTEAEMCGNGVRCLMKFICDNDKSLKDSYIVETLAGDLLLSFDDNKEIIVNMGQPIFDPDQIPTTLPVSSVGVAEGFIEALSNSHHVYSVGMGNPHAIIESDDITAINLEQLGPLIEKNSFFPKKTNVHFVQINNRENIEILHWERSCGATFACGTGACASVALLVSLNRINTKVQAKLPGGELTINWPSKQGPIYMVGSAEYVYSGSFVI